MTIISQDHQEAIQTGSQEHPTALHHLSGTGKFSANRRSSIRSWVAAMVPHMAFIIITSAIVHEIEMVHNDH